MAFRIIFKGQIPDEFMDDIRGVKISQMWEENRLTGKVNINGNVYDSSSIKAIISGFTNPDSSAAKEKHIQDIKEIREDNQKYLARKMAMTAEERAKDTGLAELVYSAFARKPMPPEIKEEVIKRQTTFFKENPTYADAKPTCYRDLIPKPQTSRNDLPPSIGDLAPAWALGFAERVVSNGIH